MRLIRLILGKLILFFNWLFPPRGIEREAALQATVDEQTASLKLYQYEACPFCVRVRRSLKRNSLTIETSDIRRSEVARAELLAGGGDLMVPCLRIENGPGEVSWMYESREIIRYLERRFLAG